MCVKGKKKSNICKIHAERVLFCFVLSATQNNPLDISFITYKQSYNHETGKVALTSKSLVEVGTGCPKRGTAGKFHLSFFFPAYQISKTPSPTCQKPHLDVQLLPADLPFHTSANALKLHTLKRKIISQFLEILKY